MGWGESPVSTQRASTLCTVEQIVPLLVNLGAATTHSEALLQSDPKVPLSSKALKIEARSFCVFFFSQFVSVYMQEMCPKTAIKYW